MKLVELFCGTGGFSLGAHRAGFDVAAAYDIDEILTSSYPANFPDTVLHHTDVTHLTGERIRADVGAEVFGLFGGPPCQGFSSIGKRASDDPRRELLGHFFRIVSELRPQFFVMENVQGLAFSDARPVLDRAMQLVNHDYDILGPHVWNAADFGAATSRNRVFVIGVQKERRTPLVKADVERWKRKAANVKQAIADLNGAVPMPDDPAAGEFDRWQIRRPGQPSDYARELRAPDNIFTGHKPTAHTDAVVARFRAVLPGTTEKIGRHPRLQWNGLCPTLRAGTGADKGSFQSVRPIHPTEPRVITVREAARLQGFPDSHLFHPTIWHSFRMIGNSVSPIMAKAVFSAIWDRVVLKAPPVIDLEKRERELQLTE
jgi:DNA (cytosine-5)-methyltransferase 1